MSCAPQVSPIQIITRIKNHCQLTDDTCLLTLRIFIFVIERVFLDSFGCTLLCIQKKKKVNLLVVLVQNPFHIRGPVLVEACSVRVVGLCPSPRCHRVPSGHWASPSEPLSSVGRLWCWSFVVLIRRHSVNSQGRPLPHRSLTGLLAGGVTVQWSRTATSCLGGRDREAHPDFKDDRMSITALLRSRRLSSSAAFVMM